MGFCTPRRTIIDSEKIIHVMLGPTCTDRMANARLGFPDITLQVSIRIIWGFPRVGWDVLVTKITLTRSPLKPVLWP